MQTTISCAKIDVSLVIYAIKGERTKVPIDVRRDKLKELLRPISAILVPF